MSKLINIKVDERLLKEINFRMRLLEIDDENAKLKLVTNKKLGDK